jgi:hypothetical protein
LNHFHVDMTPAADPSDPNAKLSEWQKRHGSFRLPYAAGIPGETRIIYMPLSDDGYALPTVLGLEPGVRYHAYFWDPSLGIKFDLGAVQRPAPGTVIRQDFFFDDTASPWSSQGAKLTHAHGELTIKGRGAAVMAGVNETDLVAAVDARSAGDVGLILRFHDDGQYLAAVYSATDASIYILDRRGGTDGERLGRVPAPELKADIKLMAEVRGPRAAVSVTDGIHNYTSQIVDVSNTMPGAVGLLQQISGGVQSFGRFEVRKSPTLLTDKHLQRKLYDAAGHYRGEFKGAGIPSFTALGMLPWDSFGQTKSILLDAYRPEALPYSRDWVLVLERKGVTHEAIHE